MKTEQIIELLKNDIKEEELLYYIDENTDLVRLFYAADYKRRVYIFKAICVYAPEKAFEVLEKTMPDKNNEEQIKDYLYLIDESMLGTDVNTKSKRLSYKTACIPIIKEFFYKKLIFFLNKIIKSKQDLDKFSYEVESIFSKMMPGKKLTSREILKFLEGVK